MKSTGIVRKMDELGRVVIPMELRRNLNIAEKDALEIYVEGDDIILRKHNFECVLCKETNDLVDIPKSKSKICPSCLANMKNIL
ncbi:AbrB/MazE/SpoVT family DNA-binding domain-containing protein [Clostridium botulinum]|uniref:AbrB/MazE/SpoVT family DNA-binding domain-containing protein n=1 Tax=Clostridium sp. VAP51 TaxID=2949978 RepID=UPI0004FFB3DD|nr:AbrB/MazE/SpoVT family DNA-binding domain-containing protein [Clostridium sp. VAP51]KFX58400.1 AbrB family transcriptional regulator [Clostridium botulinum]MBY6778568.1 AbrB/MazE/SpoVT family DNA-binding domain-containing protein [Clostridium botulinum]MBY6851747.1 AbrB/MazE/SpoVT family DNA-binding domain-containing protein [Clostridium botulinum]NFI05178.1 AbrB/MazE/SpoVT family DNA-binding domain-containing protein [Clostridium botulinum]NFS11753.1 AbrB/MazE/SpoVT family DNA-binding doma